MVGQGLKKWLEGREGNIVSVLGKDNGYTVKYSRLPEGVPGGTPEDERLYLYVKFYCHMAKGAILKELIAKIPFWKTIYCACALHRSIKTIQSECLCIVYLFMCLLNTYGSNISG